MKHVGQYEIVNVVATCTLDHRLKCDNIAQSTPNCEYDPKRFAALKHRVRLRGFAPTFLVFASGKIVCVGTRSKEMAFSAIERFLAHLRDDLFLLTPCSEVSLCVRNVVAHASVGAPLALDRIAADRWDTTHFEPELFPGLTSDVIIDGKRAAVCNLFASGKLVVTGTTDEAGIERALAVVDEWIGEYKKPPPPNGKGHGADTARPN